MKIKKHIRKIHRSPYIYEIVIAIVAVCIMSAALLYATTAQTKDVGRLVTFHDGGLNKVILTHASTVRGALQDAEITVDPHDIVEPSRNTKITKADSAIIIYRSRPVLIIDGALKQKVLTPAQSPNEIMHAAHLNPITSKDKTKLQQGNLIAEGATTILTVKRSKLTPQKVVYTPKANALTKSRGAQLYTDNDGVVHRETYYDLPMNIVIGACGKNNKYTIRSDGAKIDKDGYILVAASYRVYPRCSIVETSMGPGKVYDTGGFALRYPHGFDLATDWTNYNGQ